MDDITRVTVRIELSGDRPDLEGGVPVSEVSWEVNDYGIDVTAFPKDIRDTPVCEVWGPFMAMDEVDVPGWVPTPPEWFARAAEGVLGDD